MGIFFYIYYRQSFWGETNETPPPLSLSLTHTHTHTCTQREREVSLCIYLYKNILIAKSKDDWILNNSMTELLNTSFFLFIVYLSFISLFENDGSVYPISLNERNSNYRIIGIFRIPKMKSKVVQYLVVRKTQFGSSECFCQGREGDELHWTMRCRVHLILSQCNSLDLTRSWKWRTTLNSEMPSSPNPLSVYSIDLTWS